MNAAEREIVVRYFESTAHLLKQVRLAGRKGSNTSEDLSSLAEHADYLLGRFDPWIKEYQRPSAALTQEGA